MMYVAHSTANPLGQRPWQSRLALGAYRASTLLIPTQTAGQTIGPTRQVTGGLGQFDVGSLLPWGIAIVALGLLLFGPRVKRLGRSRRRKPPAVAGAPPAAQT